MVKTKINILKTTEPYRVVIPMEAHNEYFPDQVKFWRYDVI
jgi:hypothetical protein